MNHQVCHGVPGDKVLRAGDIVNIDITVIKDGWHGDTSRMFYVGEPTVQARRLCESTYECMWKGIALVRPGAFLGDIGAAIQRHAESKGFSVVREFCGHGIGKRFHEEPQVLHYGRPGQGVKLAAGMTFTIEPMINAGKRDIRQMNDGWTIVTADHSLSAQWEHTVLVTADGYEVLTVSAGTPAAACLRRERTANLVGLSFHHACRDHRGHREPLGARTRARCAAASKARARARCARTYLKRPDPAPTSRQTRGHRATPRCRSSGRASISRPRHRAGRRRRLRPRRALPAFRRGRAGAAARRARTRCRRRGLHPPRSGTWAWSPATACAPSPSASRRR